MYLNVDDHSITCIDSSCYLHRVLLLDGMLICSASVAACRCIGCHFTYVFKWWHHFDCGRGSAALVRLLYSCCWPPCSAGFSKNCIIAGIMPVLCRYCCVQADINLNAHDWLGGLVQGGSHPLHVWLTHLCCCACTALAHGVHTDACWVLVIEVRISYCVCIVPYLTRERMLLLNVEGGYQGGPSSLRGVLLPSLSCGRHRIIQAELVCNCTSSSGTLNDLLWCIWCVAAACASYQCKWHWLSLGTTHSSYGRRSKVYRALVFTHPPPSPASWGYSVLLLHVSTDLNNT